MDERRIKEAEANVRNYLNDGLLKKVGKADENVLRVLRKNSEDSLRIADLLFKGDYSQLWVIVCSYYAMYYMANAVLYSLGHKVGQEISHKITSEALIVFVRGKLRGSLLREFEEARDEALEMASLRANELIESFDLERLKRSRFQYEMTEEVKRGKAGASLERAKRFVFEMEKLLVK